MWKTIEIINRNINLKLKSIVIYLQNGTKHDSEQLIFMYITKFMRNQSNVEVKIDAAH